MSAVEWGTATHFTHLRETDLEGSSPPRFVAGCGALVRVTPGVKAPRCPRCEAIEKERGATG